MRIEAALVGGLPRPYRIGRLMSKYRDGKVDEETYMSRLRKELVKALRRVERYGVTIVVNSMFLWDDLFQPFAEAFEGVERGGLYRFLDNNFYYRVPIIKGPIRHRPASLSHFKLVKGLVEEAGLNLSIKAVIPGPYTFTLMSENRFYNSARELALELAEALGKEARLLGEAGAEFVEVHEPLLTLQGVQVDLFKHAYERLSSKVSAGLWLQTYFGPLEHVLEELEGLRIDVLGVDAVEAPKQLEGILGFDAGWGLAIGAVDSRNTRVERVGELRRLVQMAAERFDRVFLTPNSMMDFIPVQVAFRKLRVLGMAVRGVVGGG